MAAGGLGYVLMVLVALQVGVQPQVTRACVAPAVSGQSLVVAELLLSIALACAVMPEGALEKWSAVNSARFAGPPAVAYALRSLVKQAAYRRCDGVTFNVLNQTKVVFCALAAWLLAGEAQTVQQCAALVCAMSAGALLVVPSRAPQTAKGQKLHGCLVGVAAEDGMQDDEEEAKTPRMKGVEGPMAAVSGLTSASPGVLLALATAACSGTAAALSQIAMSDNARPSVLFNLELGLWGLPFVLASVAGGKTSAPAFDGWRCWTVAPVLLQAAGGLLVSAVVKEQGGVAMGLCTVAGISVSALVDTLCTRQPPSARQVGAAALCGLSVCVHQLESTLWRPSAAAFAPPGALGASAGR